MMRGDLLTRVISSASEKSFSFAVKKKQEGIGKRETPYSIHSGITAFHSRREKRTVNEKKHPRRCLGSQPSPLRGTSFHRKEGESCPCIASPYRHFERKREIFFVCAQEEMRGHRKTGSPVLHTLLAHGVSFAKETASGQRKALSAASMRRGFL